MRASLLLGLVVLTACTAGPSQPVEPTESAIINGRATRAQEWAVAVARLGSMGGLCTGTVIGDYAVLTAKHCVFSEDSPGVWTAVPPVQLVVVVGYDINRAAGIERTIVVREVRTTRGSDVDSDIMNGNDVAVLLLPSAIGTSSRRIQTDPPVRGTPVQIVGFGRTMSGTPVDGDSGVKHIGDARVGRVYSRLVESTGTSWTCQGDSGGPLINTNNNQIIGVTSFGSGGCTFSNSFYSRVDNHRALINDALRFMPPCMPSPETCGDGIDNDCDGMEDEDCTPLGESCRMAGECSGGTCEDVGGTRVCVRECDPRERIPRCPFGFYCQATACGVGRCIAGDPGTLPEGAECTADLMCSSTHCADVGGVMRCGRQCDPMGEPCGGDEVCESLGAECGSCIPAEISTGPRPFAAPCTADGECVSTLCSDEGFCTRTCDAVDLCPAGFHCRGGECHRGDPGGPGAPCVTPEDCDPMLAADCVEADGELICAAPCSDSSMCSEGYECGSIGAGPHCVRPGLPLGEACTDHIECRSGICSGVCTRICDTEACPEGFECRPAGSVNGCFPPDFMPGVDPSSGGGCATAPGNAAGALAAFGLLVAVVLMLGRRRPRRKA